MLESRHGVERPPKLAQSRRKFDSSRSERVAVVNVACGTGGLRPFAGGSLRRGTAILARRRFVDGTMRPEAARWYSERECRESAQRELSRNRG